VSDQVAPPPRQAPGPGGYRPRRGPVQPVRALVVVAIGVVVAVYVLARTTAPSPKVAAARGGVHATTTTTTSVPAKTTTTQAAATTTTTVATTTTSTTVPPSSVTVLVLNGWTTPHAALYFQRRLAAQGYDTRAPNNAISDTNKTSLVYFTSPAYRSNALAIAAAVHVPSSDVVAPTAANDAPVPSADLLSSDIVLLVGADISAQVPANYNG